MVIHVDVLNSSKVTLGNENSELFKSINQRLKQEITRLQNEGFVLNSNDVLCIHKNENAEYAEKIEEKDVVYYQIEHRTYYCRKGELYLTYFVKQII